MSLSMGTHDLRFLRNFFANLRFFDIINIINRFSLAVAQCGFVAVTINLFRN